MHLTRQRLAIFVTAALLLLIARPGGAFSVLAHQAVVDEAWHDTLMPLIHRRFPNATEKQLADAQAYARGGSHLPDLGYFPLGSRLFTDFLHYVRTGNFVSRLLAEAGSPNEYAFALGALDHYEVDTIGHPQATNRAVQLIYPKLAKKYGDKVTYADSARRPICRLNFVSTCCRSPAAQGVICLPERPITPHIGRLKISGRPISEDIISDRR
jgi:Zinc dependent phospholipase C